MVAPSNPNRNVPARAGVPHDLLGDNDRWKAFHQWKSAAVVKACQPLGKLLDAPAADCPAILMYHRVVPVGNHSEPTWNVTPDVFEDQLRGLLRRGYEPLQLSALLRLVANGQPIPPHSFVVTFDDGYANNAQFATPVLKKLNVPATVFLATKYLESNQPFPFDDWQEKGSRGVDASTWRAATIAECEQMLESGVIEFGSHTHTHEDFRERPDAFEVSLLQSLEVLDQRFGIKQPTLSLPYGIVNQGFAGPSYFDISRELGCTCCLTTEEELVDVAASPFGWGRFIAEQHDTADSLAVKIDGWRDIIRNVWRVLRGKKQAIKPKH